MELGVAIIGLGIMGTRMMSSLTSSSKFRLVAAWDPNDHACGVAAVDYPGLQIAKDAATAIGADGVDIVYIACPPGAHVDYAVMAADAGKAVYCEKPLGVDIAESEQLVHMIAERQIINAVNFPFAASSSVDVIESELASGALGEIVGVDLRLHFVPWPRGWQQEATWLSRRAEGGYVREVGSHFVFLIEKLFGPAELTDSSVAYPEDDEACETLFSANLDCAGLPISMSGTSMGVGPDTVELIIWGSELGDGWHGYSRYRPVLIGGSWAFNTGRYLYRPHQTPAEMRVPSQILTGGSTRVSGLPHQHLLVSVARAMGLEVDHVGLSHGRGHRGDFIDVSGPLPGLAA